VQDEAGGWEIAGDAEARLHLLLIYQELIVVPTQPGIDGPIAEMDQVFDEG
jgi:hypothetical protein